MLPSHQVVCSCTNYRRHTFNTSNGQLIHEKMSPNTCTAYSQRDVVIFIADRDWRKLPDKVSVPVNTELRFPSSTTRLRAYLYNQWKMNMRVWRHIKENETASLLGPNDFVMMSAIWSSVAICTPEISLASSLKFCLKCLVRSFIWPLLGPTVVNVMSREWNNDMCHSISLTAVEATNLASIVDRETDVCVFDPQAAPWSNMTRWTSCPPDLLPSQNQRIPWVMRESSRCFGIQACNGWFHGDSKTCVW